MMAKRQCGNAKCGEIFQPQSAHARYCSSNCRVTAWLDRGGKATPARDPRLELFVAAVVELGEDPGRAWDMPNAFREAARRAGIDVPAAVLRDRDMARVVGGAA